MSEQGHRRWMITGVSTGLGRALMDAALERGEKVVGTARQVDSCNELEARWPDQARIIPLDVTDARSAMDAVAQAADWLGGIDVLVNNAGIGVFGTVEACSVEDFAHAMDVNYYGLLRVTRPALVHLRASHGTLVNVASMAGFLGFGGTSAYAASKHAVVGVSESLSEELAPHGVKVIIPMPGGFRTNFWSPQSNIIREGLSDIYGTYPCGQIGERSQQHVGHEMGDPVKYANALIDAVYSENPPLYYVFGGDALEYVGLQRDAMVAELDAHRSVGLATAYD